MTSQPVEPTSDAPAAMPETGPERRQLTVRLAPKFVPFMIAGAVVAAIVAGILTAFSPSTQEYATMSVFGFFFVMLLVPGVGVGCIVALVIDRLSVRSAKTAIVESLPEDNTSGQDTSTQE